MRSPVAVTSSHMSATPICLTLARHRTVCATIAGVLGLPRCGIGARNGASVSVRSRSGGATAAASRSAGALVNVTVPAKLITYPAAAHRLAIAASPEKQWNTTRSGGPSAARIASTSSCASRSWIISALPACLAISMCARNHSRWTSGTA